MSVRTRPRSAQADFVITTISGIPVIVAPDAVDVTNADALRVALAAGAARGHATLIVDMSRTHCCDTAGLHVLVRGHKRLAAEGGELRLVVQADSLARLLGITGIDRVIPSFATIGAAVCELPAAAIRPRASA